MHRSLLAACAAASLFPALAPAAVVRMDGIADSNTAYYEQPSDAFYRMDLFDPPPRQTQQRFHAISNPAVQFGNLAFDGFPNDNAFRLGTITYNEAASAVVNGTGFAPITAASIGVYADPTNPAYLNYSRFAVTSTLSNLTGNVQLVNNVPVAINLQSVLTIVVDPAPTIVFTGTFRITGDRFAGYAATPSTGPDSQRMYDFNGTLTTVPEPASMAMLGGFGLLSLRRWRA